MFPTGYILDMGQVIFDVVDIEIYKYYAPLEPTTNAVFHQSLRSMIRDD